MNEFTIYLKNGVSFVIYCDELEIDYSKMTGKIFSYHYKDAKSNIPLYINVDDISAVIQKEIKHNV